MGCQKLIYKPELGIYSSKNIKGRNEVYIYIYRFGFNGEMIEDEIAGEGMTYDLGERFYDGRIGRMFKRDPLAYRTPAWSPYAYCGNRPVTSVDIKGAKIGKESLAQHAEKTNSLLEKIKDANKNGQFDRVAEYEKELAAMKKMEKSEVIFHYTGDENVANGKAGVSAGQGGSKDKDGKGEIYIYVDPNNKDASMAYGIMICDQFLKSNNSFSMNNTGKYSKNNGYLTDRTDIEEAMEHYYLSDKAQDGLSYLEIKNKTKSFVSSNLAKWGITKETPTRGLDLIVDPRDGKEINTSHNAEFNVQNHNGWIYNLVPGKSTYKDVFRYTRNMDINNQQSKSTPSEEDKKTTGGDPKCEPVQTDYYMLEGKFQTPRR